MTVEEFKAFLEGMDIQGAPTPDQWARVKEKVDALSAGSVQYVPLPYYTAPSYTVPSPYHQWEVIS